MLFCMTLSGGCASVWLTPTPAGVTPSPVPPSEKAQDTPSTATPPTRSSAETTPPSLPTMQLAPLVLSEAPLQSWSNANEIGGLLYDGQYLWAATGGGVVRWEINTGESLLYTVQDGLASLAIRGIACDGEGHIWVGYVDHGTWSEYDGEKWSSYESREKAVENRYKAMLAASDPDPRLWSWRDSGDWLWLPTRDGGVAAYDGSKWRVYGEKEGVRRNTWLVAVSPAGRVWAIGEGISTAEEGERQWEDHSFPGEAPEDNETTALAVDGQGRAWLAFASHHHQSAGVGSLDVAADRWVIYSHALDPAIPRQVYGLEFDSDGTLWLSGDQGITFRQPDGRWGTIAPALTAQCFARDPEGRFWIGTMHGIWSVDADGSDLRGPWLVPSSILDNEVTALAMDGQGTLWLGTPAGLSYAESSGRVGIAMMDEEVLCLAASSKGEVWAGTRSGVYALRTDGPCERLFDQPVATLALDTEGTLWACTQDGQIGRLQGTEWQPTARVAALATAPPRDMLLCADGSIWLGTASGLGILSADGSFSWPDPEEQFLRGDIRALARGPDGVIWVGSASGLARRSNSGGWVRLTPTSTDGGLRSTEIWDLLMDAEGTLWIATAAGISARTAKTDWSYYDLPGVRAIWPGSAGEVWAGTRGGLYRMRRDLLVAVP